MEFTWYFLCFCGLLHLFFWYSELTLGGTVRGYKNNINLPHCNINKSKPAKFYVAISQLIDLFEIYY